MSKQLYIYLIKQTLNNDYDTFDSFMVVSESEKTALTYHPRKDRGNWSEHDQQEWHEYGLDPDWEWDMYFGWPVPQKLEGNTTVILCGEALPTFPEGKILCASFNAG